MKRFISLLLTLTLLLGCSAAAEAPAVVTLTLQDAGVTLEVPADWYYATLDTGDDSPLAQLSGMSGALLQLFMKNNGFSFYATTDPQELTVCYLTVAEGTPLIDMRDKQVNMDALMEGFMQTFNAGEVVDSRAFITSEAAFARILCSAPVDGGQASMLVYACNTDSRLYFISFIAYPGMTIPEAELDAMVNSIRFAD